MLKNPFKINFIWLGTIILLLGAVLLVSCGCGEYCFNFRSRTENILLGIFSSAILLFFNELLNYIIDIRRYGFLHGKYKRTIITQLNNGGVRSSEIRDADQIERNENVKFITDSCYHYLSYYKCESVNYFIELKYQYNGIYTGYAEYFDHKSGNWKENRMLKVKTVITLNLNLANKMTGSGSYKYSQVDDFGRYEFQVDDENYDRIIANYKNTAPSGLSEGYEIWEKI